MFDLGLLSKPAVQPGSNSGLFLNSEVEGIGRESLEDLASQFSRHRLLTM